MAVEAKQKQKYTLKQSLKLGSDKKGGAKKEYKAGDTIELTEERAKVFKAKKLI